MNKEKEPQRGFFKYLSKSAWFIDENLRFGDLHGNRTAGGFLDKKWGICRHSYQYLLLPTLMVAIIIMGVPEWGARLLLAIVAAVVVFFLLKYLAQSSIKSGRPVRDDMVLQIIVVLTVAFIVLCAGPNIYKKGILIYRHFFILAAGIVGLSLVASGFCSGWIFNKLRLLNNYNQALAKTELFISRDPDIRLGFFSLIRSFFLVVPGAPLQLLLPPAFFILLAPPHWLNCIAFISLLISYCILLMGGFDARLRQIWSVFEDIFFRGGALLVSLMIIAIAAARFFGVSYVTTVFDTAEGVVIALLLFSSYVLLWWYDYWVNRLLAQELITLINADALCDAQIPYPIEADCQHTSVLQKGRVLQIHGASRFIVIGSSNKDTRPRFQAYSFEKLFESLAAGGFPGGKAIPSPAQIAEGIFNYKCLAGIILLAFSVMVGLYISCGVQEPQLKAENSIAPTLRLGQLLDDHTRDRGSQPALIIAASGGGTRAALFTAAVMEGLATRGRIKDVIMGSGVSGGGAALAYFAGKRPALIEADENAWNEYFDTMRKPFIRDVIDGALEWRTVSSSRLGVLLTESFERLWKLAPERNKLGEIQDFGLILNTAIAGKFQCDDESKECLSMPLIRAEQCFRKKMSHNELAGGRAVDFYQPFAGGWFRAQCCGDGWT